MNETDDLFGGFFTAVEERAANSIKVNEGDYEVDGLLYCFKCDTPKQCKIELFGKERKPMCLCKCQAERVEKEREAYEKKERMDRIAKIRKTGFPESDMQNWTFAADDLSNPKITQVAQNYVEHFPEMIKKGKGLLMYGSVGTGKSFASACIANALIDKGFPCLMTNFARLVNQIGGMYEGKQEYIDSLNRFDLLILDDLAAERNTEYVNEIVQNIIDSRCRAKLPTIITTNLTVEEIRNPKDISKQRTYSRILELCVPIKVEGSDKRREKAKSEYDEMKTLLGL